MFLGKVLLHQEVLFLLDYLLQEDLGLVRLWVLVGLVDLGPVCLVQVHQADLEY